MSGPFMSVPRYVAPGILARDPKDWLQCDQFVVHALAETFEKISSESIGASASADFDNLGALLRAAAGNAAEALSKFHIDTLADMSPAQRAAAAADAHHGIDAVARALDDFRNALVRDLRAAVRAVKET